MNWKAISRPMMHTTTLMFSTLALRELAPAKPDTPPSPRIAPRTCMHVPHPSLSPGCSAHAWHLKHSLCSLRTIPVILGVPWPLVIATRAIRTPPASRATLTHLQALDHFADPGGGVIHAACYTSHNVSTGSGQ